MVFTLNLALASYVWTQQGPNFLEITITQDGQTYQIDATGVGLPIINSATISTATGLSILSFPITFRQKSPGGVITTPALFPDDQNLGSYLEGDFEYSMTIPDSFHNFSFTIEKTSQITFDFFAQILYTIDTNVNDDAGAYTLEQYQKLNNAENLQMAFESGSQYEINEAMYDNNLSTSYQNLERAYEDKMTDEQRQLLRDPTFEHLRFIKKLKNDLQLDSEKPLPPHILDQLGDTKLDSDNYFDVFKRIQPGEQQRIDELLSRSSDPLEDFSVHILDPSSEISLDQRKTILKHIDRVFSSRGKRTPQNILNDINTGVINPNNYEEVADQYRSDPFDENIVLQYGVAKPGDYSVYGNITPHGSQNHPLLERFVLDAHAAWERQLQLRYPGTDVTVYKFIHNTDLYDTSRNAHQLALVMSQVFETTNRLFGDSLPGIFFDGMLESLFPSSVKEQKYLYRLPEDIHDNSGALNLVANLGADLFRLWMFQGYAAYPAYALTAHVLAPAVLKQIAQVSFGQLDNPIYQAAYEKLPNKFKAFIRNKAYAYIPVEEAARLRDNNAVQQNIVARIPGIKDGIQNLAHTMWDSKGKITMVAAAISALGYVYYNMVQPHRGLKTNFGTGLVPSDYLFTSENQMIHKGLNILNNHNRAINKNEPNLIALEYNTNPAKSLAGESNTGLAVHGSNSFHSQLKSVSNDMAALEQSSKALSFILGVNIKPSEVQQVLESGVQMTEGMVDLLTHMANQTTDKSQYGQALTKFEDPDGYLTPAIQYGRGLVFDVANKAGQFLQTQSIDYSRAQFTPHEQSIIESSSNPRQMMKLIQEYKEPIYSTTAQPQEIIAAPIKPDLMLDFGPYSDTTYEIKKKLREEQRVTQNRDLYSPVVQKSFQQMLDSRYPAGTQFNSDKATRQNLKMAQQESDWRMMDKVKEGIRHRYAMSSRRKLNIPSRIARPRRMNLLGKRIYRDIEEE